MEFEETTVEDPLAQHLIYQPLLYLAEYDLGHRTKEELRGLIDEVARDGA